MRLSDFQSSATQIGNSNTFSLRSSAGMSFLFSMSNYEFMFTKNFNSKVSCTFTRNAAILIAPDSIFANQLVNFAQYEFDLTELYARNFRQQLYEKKGAFSGAGFFQPIYDTLQQQYAVRDAESGKLTNFGQDSAKLTELHNAVLEEINSLSDFCKTCKQKRIKIRVLSIPFQILKLAHWLILTFAFYAGILQFSYRIQPLKNH